LGNIHYKAGDKKKAKFHFEAAAMTGHEMARSNLGGLECNSGNMERAVQALEDCGIRWRIPCHAII